MDHDNSQSIDLSELLGFYGHLDQVHYVCTESIREESSIFSVSRTVGFSEKVLNLLNTTVAKSYKKSSLSLWILSQGC